MDRLMDVQLPDVETVLDVLGNNVQRDNLSLLYWYERISMAYFITSLT